MRFWQFAQSTFDRRQKYNFCLAVVSFNNAFDTLCCRFGRIMIASDSSWHCFQLRFLWRIVQTVKASSNAFCHRVTFDLMWLDSIIFFFSYYVILLLFYFRSLLPLPIHLLYAWKFYFAPIFAHISFLWICGRFFHNSIFDWWLFLPVLILFNRHIMNAKRLTSPIDLAFSLFRLHSDLTLLALLFFFQKISRKKRWIFLSQISIVSYSIQKEFHEK